MDKQEIADKAEAAGKTFKAKVIDLVTNKFWIAIGVVVVVVIVAIFVF